jgi:hypothetical protein
MTREQAELLIKTLYGVQQALERIANKLEESNEQESK